MPTDNAEAEKVDSLIEKASGIEGTILLNLLISRAPIFGAPGLKWLTKLLIGWLLDPMTDAAELWATYRVIEAQVASEESDVGKAKAQLLDALKSADPARIALAKEDYEKAEDALDHFDGASHPQ